MTQHSDDYLAGFRDGAETMQHNPQIVPEICNAGLDKPGMCFYPKCAIDPQFCQTVKRIAAAIRALPLPKPPDNV